MLYSSGLDARRVVLFGVRQWLVVEAWRLKSHYLCMVAGQKSIKEPFDADCRAHFLRHRGDC